MAAMLEAAENKVADCRMKFWLLLPAIKFVYLEIIKCDIPIASL
jgi:hypothetical protein